MKFSIKELENISGGNLITQKDPSKKVSISTDSRNINENEFFLPLKGGNFDGHNFIKQALEKGCKGYFTEKKDLTAHNNSEFIILIENSTKTYLKTAHFARRKINPKLIAVTGSSGKTSTKEFIYSVLSTVYKTHKSKLNHNNEIGLCQTLLSMPEDTDFVVVEMGMRGTGEIELLSKYSEPDLAVITNVGTAHIGRLGSIENIAKAKCEITSHLKNDGLFLAYDDDLIKNTSKFSGKSLFYGKDYEITKQKSDLTGFIYKDKYYEIPVIGEYNVINAIAAIETGKHAGIEYENIKQGLLNYSTVGDRGNIIQLENGAKLIVDCYNANPDSVMVSVKSIAKTFSNSDITVVLGDMAELGIYEDELHKKVGEFIGNLPVNKLVTVGEKSKFVANAVKNNNIHTKSFNNNQEAADFLLDSIKERSVILFKGSRCMKLEEIADKIKQKYFKANRTNYEKSI